MKELDIVKILPINIEGMIINKVYDLETYKTKYHVYGNDNKNYVVLEKDLIKISDFETEIETLVEENTPKGQA